VVRLLLCLPFKILNTIVLIPNIFRPSQINLNFENTINIIEDNKNRDNTSIIRLYMTVFMAVFLILVYYNLLQ